MKFRILLTLLTALFVGLFAIPAFSAPQAAPQEIVVEGRVCDSAGAPVSGASVLLETESSKAIVSAFSDSSGHFRLRAPADTKIRVHVRQRGFSDRAVAYDGTMLKIVLQKSAASPGVEFSDSPNFTVAGVTDWSNVGLHGSDVNVKTSEALTKEAVALKPANNTAGNTNKDAEAHRLLGGEKEKNGDPVSAEREYEIAVKLDPSEENYFAWGAELLLHRAGVAAVEVLSRGATAHPNSQRMVEALGAAFYANGQFAESAQQMCRAADLLPSTAEPYLFLGRIEQAASDMFPCSERRLQRFAAEQPRNGNAAFYYGLVLMKKAKQSQRDTDFRRAEEFFKDALAIDSSFGEVYLQLGMLYNARGEKEAALQEFENAVRAAPGLTAAHYQLSLAYRRSGVSGKADEELKKYEELHRSEEVALEKERKEMKQFVTILQQSSPKQ